MSNLDKVDKYIDDFLEIYEKLDKIYDTPKMILIGHMREERVELAMRMLEMKQRDEILEDLSHWDWS